MEKIKGFKDQVVNAGKKGKDKLDAIKSKEWAEPTGKALKAAASVVSVIPPPVGSVLKGALSMGGAVLNPDPTLADLRRAKDEINNAMQAAFQEVAEDMGDMKTELSDLRGDIGPVLQLISDKEFYDGIATIDAHHDFYTENPEDLDGTNQDFEAVATSFQISFKKNFRVSKIFHFLKMIQKQEGNEACNKYFQDNLVSYGKYLQIIFAYLTYKGDLKKIKILTEKFLKDYEELTTLFEGLQVIPVEEEVMKRRESVTKKSEDSKLEFGDEEVAKVVEMAKNTEAKTKEANTTSITKMMPVVQEMMKRGKSIKVAKSPDSKDEFEDEEVAKLVEKAKEREAKAKNGHIKEAKSMFAEIFEEMKAKRFSAIQTKLQCCDL